MTEASGQRSSLKKKKRRSSGEKEPKVPTDVVSAAKPINQEEEKQRFFSGEDPHYEPQFVYALPTEILALALQRYASNVSDSCCASCRYVPHALRIMRAVVRQYGSFDKWTEENGGEILDEAEARVIVDEYLEAHGVENEITVKFNPNLVARASFMKKASQLNIRTTGLRRHWIQGMLHHEIGTHCLRELNDQNQPWAKVKKGRKRFGLQDKNPTEEGLASLHTVLERDGHFLWRAALLYYTTWKASQLSFRELYEDLAQFLGHNPDERWDYCFRAKRGLLDTSQPGGFVKDQMYLTGAMEILEQRRVIDFEAMYIGKLSVPDAHRAKCTGLARLDNLRLPIFLATSEDRRRYLELMDEIVRDNDLTDLIDGPEKAPKCFLRSSSKEPPSTTSSSSSSSSTRRSRMTGPITIPGSGGGSSGVVPALGGGGHLGPAHHSPQHLPPAAGGGGGAHSASSGLSSISSTTSPPGPVGLDDEPPRTWRRAGSSRESLGSAGMSGSGSGGSSRGLGAAPRRMLTKDISQNIESTTTSCLSESEEEDADSLC